MSFSHSVVSNKCSNSFGMARVRLMARGGTPEDQIVWSLCHAEADIGAPWKRPRQRDLGDVPLAHARQQVRQIGDRGDARVGRDRRVVAITRAVFAGLDLDRAQAGALRAPCPRSIPLPGSPRFSSGRHPTESFRLG